MPERSKTLLLVDDHEAVRELVRRILVGCDYNVLEASCGAEALRIAENTEASLDLLITDIMMAPMSGPELAKRVRELRPGIPVLYLSGGTDEEVREELRCSLSAMLEKPFARDDLVATVREMLAR